MKNLILVYDGNEAKDILFLREVGFLFQSYLPHDYVVEYFDCVPYWEHVQCLDGVLRLDREHQTAYTCGDAMGYTEGFASHWIVKSGFKGAHEIAFSGSLSSWIVADTCASSGRTILHVLQQIHKAQRACSSIVVGIASRKAIERMETSKIPIHVMRSFEEGRILELRDVLGEGSQFMVNRDGTLQKIRIEIEDIVGSLPLTFRAQEEICSELRRIQRK